jgi:hypothetical protein
VALPPPPSTASPIAVRSARFVTFPLALGHHTMTRPSLKSTLALLLAIAVLAALAAGAFAYWSGSGATTATIVVPDPQDVTFSLGAPTAELYPGHEAGVAIVVHNRNSYFVRVAALQLDVTHVGIPPFAVDTDHSGCDVSALSFTTQDNGGAGWNIPPRVASADGLRTLDMSSAIQMAANADDACQGATFTVRLQAAG